MSAHELKNCVSQTDQSQLLLSMWWLEERNSSHKHLLSKQWQINNRYHVWTHECDWEDNGTEGVLSSHGGRGGWWGRGETECVCVCVPQRRINCEIATDQLCPTSTLSTGLTGLVQLGPTGSDVTHTDYWWLWPLISNSNTHPERFCCCSHTWTLSDSWWTVIYQLFYWPTLPMMQLSLWPRWV